MKEGSCQCGAIEYKYSGTPLTCCVCHCTDCQTGSGSAFAVSLVVKHEDIEITSGDIVEDSYQLNGNDLIRARCSECSTGLWYVSKAMPDIVSLQPGTLRDTSWVRPVAHVWTRSAQSWINFDPSMKKYETQGDIPELIELWKQQNKV